MRIYTQRLIAFGIAAATFMPAQAATYSDLQGYDANYWEGLAELGLVDALNVSIEEAREAKRLQDGTVLAATVEILRARTEASDLISRALAAFNEGQRFVAAQESEKAEAAFNMYTELLNEAREVYPRYIAAQDSRIRLAVAGGRNDQRFDDGDDPMIIKWRLQLCNDILHTYLPVVLTNGHDAYGLTGADEAQKEGFEMGMRLAYEHAVLAQADVDMATDTATRDAAFRRKVTLAGMFYELASLQSQQIPLLRLETYAYTGFLPDEDPVYALNVGPISGSDNPQHARERIALDARLAGARFETGATRPYALWWQSLINYNAGNYDVAMDTYLTPLSQDISGDPFERKVSLVQAAALGHQGKPVEAARLLANTWTTNRYVREAGTGVYYELVRAGEKILRDASQRAKEEGNDELAAQLNNEAYSAPYSVIMGSSDEKLVGLRHTIYEEWYKRLGDQDPTELPASVAYGVAQRALVPYSEVVKKIQALPNYGSTLAAGQRFANPYQADLEAATREILRFIEPHMLEVTPQDTLALIYNLTGQLYSSAYWFNVDLIESEDPFATMLYGANAQYQLAKEIPDSPFAGEALFSALAVYRNLYTEEFMAALGASRALNQELPVVQRYPEAMKLAIELYPNNASTFQHVPFYALYVLKPAGEIDRAIELCELVSPQNPAYYEAAAAGMSMQQDRVMAQRLVMNDDEWRQVRELARGKADAVLRQLQEPVRENKIQNSHALFNAMRALGVAAESIALLETDKPAAIRLLNEIYPLLDANELAGQPQMQQQILDLVWKIRATHISVLAETGREQDALMVARELIAPYKNNPDMSAEEQAVQAGRTLAYVLRPICKRIQNEEQEIALQSSEMLREQAQARIRNRAVVALAIDSLRAELLEGIEQEESIAVQANRAALLYSAGRYEESAELYDELASKQGYYVPRWAEAVIASTGASRRVRERLKDWCDGLDDSYRGDSELKYLLPYIADAYFVYYRVVKELGVLEGAELSRIVRAKRTRYTEILGEVAEDGAVVPNTGDPVWAARFYKLERQMLQ